VRAIFRSMRIRNFRLYATGQLIKLVGVWMLFIAQDWLTLDLTDDSATALGVVTALQFTPVLLLTLVGGRLADRYDKRRLLIAANSVFACCALGLGVLAAAGLVRLWHVFAFAAAFGVVQAIETPTRQAFWSELVGPELTTNAVSLGAATFNTARVVGPAFAGLGIAWFGTGPVLLVSAAMAVAPVVLGLRIRAAELFRPDPASLPARDTRILDGLRYIWRRGDLVLVLLLVLVVGVFAFNLQLTLAVLAKTVFHTGAKAFGALTAALALGALAGALAGAVRRTRPSVYAVLLAAIVFGAFEAVLGFMPVLSAAVLWAVPTGFVMVYFAQAANQRVQLGVDAAFRGRVMSMYVLLFLGSTPLGAPLIGWISEEFGARAGIVVGGVVTLVAALLVGLMQIRRTGADVRLHLRPRLHIHVTEPARDGVPAVEVRLPELRLAS
jgi:MFS family permease